MAVKTDYYALLEIPRDADTGAIEKAVRTQTSRWRKRTESSDLSTRQEAERRMELLTEAKNTLLNAEKRGNYDQDLAVNGVEQAAMPTASGSDSEKIDWVAKARTFIERNDYHSAVYATRMALQLGFSSPELWYLRSRANLGIGELQDALYEAKEALGSEPGNIGYIGHLAVIYEARGEIPAALTTLDNGLAIHPMNRELRVAKASILLDKSRWDEALHITKALVTEKRDRMASILHVWGLMGKAESYRAPRGLFQTAFFDDEASWNGFSACCDELNEYPLERDSELEPLRVQMLEERRNLSESIFCLPFYPGFIHDMSSPRHPQFRLIVAVVATIIYSVVGLMISFWLMSFGGFGILLGLGVWGALGLAWWNSYKPRWQDHRNWYSFN